jgi:hypothetical protein
MGKGFINVAGTVPSAVTVLTTIKKIKKFKKLLISHFTNRENSCSELCS